MLMVICSQAPHHLALPHNGLGLPPHHPADPLHHGQEAFHHGRDPFHHGPDPLVHGPEAFHGPVGPHHGPVEHIDPLHHPEPILTHHHLKVIKTSNRWYWRDYVIFDKLEIAQRLSGVSTIPIWHQQDPWVCLHQPGLNYSSQPQSHYRSPLPPMFVHPLRERWSSLCLFHWFFAGLLQPHILSTRRLLPSVSIAVETILHDEETNENQPNKDTFQLDICTPRATIKHELERNKPLVDRILSDITYQSADNLVRLLSSPTPSSLLSSLLSSSPS